jgi:uncharacterized membrane protein YqgA involved in biofilm formation
VFGTLVNTLAIVAGSLVGLMFRKGIPRRYNLSVIHAIALAVVLIGLKTAFNSADILLIIFSLAIGSILGEWMQIELHLENLGQWLEARFSGAGDGVAKGFITASLVYCVGSMAIVGAMESGLTGNHQTLFAKSVLDGITSIIFASTFGIGVLFSAASVFVYQGLITIGATALKPLLTATVISQMSAVGGLLIMAIGVNLLDLTKLKVGNMLPAVFVPLLYYVIKVAAIKIGG